MYKTPGGGPALPIGAGAHVYESIFAKLLLYFAIFCYTPVRLELEVIAFSPPSQGQWVLCNFEKQLLHWPQDKLPPLGN